VPQFLLSLFGEQAKAPFCLTKIRPLNANVDGTNFTKLNLSLIKTNTRIFLYLASTSHPSAANSSSVHCKSLYSTNNVCNSRSRQVKEQNRAHRIFAKQSKATPFLPYQIKQEQKSPLPLITVQKSIKSKESLLWFMRFSSNLDTFTTITMCCLPDWLQALCCLFTCCL